ncbi:permease [Leptolyngbya sp. CCY15150]|uniref:permease n=1 Tax=Leptolyngbya sp. CCY15150 TaxID=2767772 RepID=UPI00194DFED4|nr:permease [Leptolyngbya sp. CCY15150]
MTVTPLTRMYRQMKHLDVVLGAIALLILGLLAIVPSQAIASVEFMVSSLWSVAPFLLISVAIAAYSQATGADALIAKAFQGRVVTMVPIAAVIGALSPFCSCGVIPLIAALLSMGVPTAAVMAFWLSSPLMDPSMFFLTAGTLGMPFAIAKTLAALGMGLLGGWGIWALMRIKPLTPALQNPLRSGVGNGGCVGSKIRNPKPVMWRFWSDPERQKRFGNGIRNSAIFLGKWLALAFLLESLMVAYVPDGWIGAIAGDGGLGSVITATAVGIPAYLNGYAALPLVGRLIQQGMNPGAGMAFLLAGGATSIPAMMAVFALARRPVFFAYLSFAIIGSVLFGSLYGVISGF